MSRDPFQGSYDQRSDGGLNNLATGVEYVDENDTNADFLPSINFDEFHSSLTSNDLKLDSYQMSGSGFEGRTNVRSQTYDDKMALENRRTDTAGAKMTDKKPPSLLRRLSNASRPALQSAEKGISSASQPGSFATRSRPREHDHDTTNPGHTSRTPRKSVGPGLILNTAAERENRHAGMLGQGLTDVNARLTQAASSERKNRRRSEAPGLAADHAAGRSAKVGLNRKSLWISSGSRSPLASSNAQPLTPDHTDSSVGRSPHSPGIGSGSKGLAPPTASGRRQSVMAPHVSGLGARTISPTDARRLKRLSLLPGPPPLPHSPTTPQQPKSAEQRSTTHSPASSSFGKSLTPLSALETPDGSGKSFASRPSLSSSSSVNSVRALSSASQPRSCQGVSSSRIPTPKPKPIQTSFEGSENEGDEHEEEVPPVPAIPKAYESPKDLVNQKSSEAMATRYRNHRSQSISKEHASSPNFVNKSEDKVTRWDENSNSASTDRRHRRGLTAVSKADAGAPTSLQSGVRKSLQPLRLPPLNLLPLGTPTATRISSIQPSADELDQRDLTPPPKRGVVKTPSTPMTASKATFFPRGFDDDIAAPKAGRMRSSSSHFNLRSDHTNLYNPPATSYTTPILTPVVTSRQATATPFASTSLPKNDANSGYFPESAEIVSPQSATVADAANLFNGYRIHGRKSKENLQTSATWSPAEPESSAVGTSLRRKLSLGWRRGSASKASNRNGQGVEGELQMQSKHSDMPPPKLPASATANGRAGTSPSPPAPQSSRGARRRKSSLLLHSSTPLSEKFTNKLQQNENGNPPSYRDYFSSSDRTSANSNSRRTLQSRDISDASKARLAENKADHEDLMADEDMRRLASKRKDFEIAAKELDELRAKATPKERGSAYQALQMVNLNIFERGEIIDYKEIYFCGTRGAKKHVGDLNASSANFGYDDERGDYNIVLGDHLSYRYEVVDVLGKGSFGQVVRCVDHKTGGLVAVKIIRNKKRFHQQALVEVNILKLLREWVSNG